MAKMSGDHGLARDVKTDRHAVKQAYEQDPDFGRQIADLLRIIACLRDPETGCPWDLKQTSLSLAPFVLEEAYEVAEALHAGEDPALIDELGDLLLQVVLHAQIGHDEQRFVFADIVQSISRKMVRRHPHVFGDEDRNSGPEKWAEIKAAEKALRARERGGPEDPNKAPTLLDAVSTALPAFVRARKLQEVAAKVGFDWPAPEDVFHKIEEEAKELAEALSGANKTPDHAAEELGDLLFTCVNLARKLGHDGESLLMAANLKFKHRFDKMEFLAHQSGKPLAELSPRDMENLWAKVKATPAEKSR